MQAVFLCSWSDQRIFSYETSGSKALTRLPITLNTAVVFATNKNSLTHNNIIIKIRKLILIHYCHRILMSCSSLAKCPKMDFRENRLSQNHGLPLFVIFKSSIQDVSSFFPYLFTTLKLLNTILFQFRFVCLFLIRLRQCIFGKEYHRSRVSSGHPISGTGFWFVPFRVILTLFIQLSCHLLVFC